jgi:hypothetical protein
MSIARLAAANFSVAPKPKNIDPFMQIILSFDFLNIRYNTIIPGQKLSVPDKNRFPHKYCRQHNQAMPAETASFRAKRFICHGDAPDTRKD